MESYEVIGSTVYAQVRGKALDDQELLTALRMQIPMLISTDPDDYRTTREIVFEAGRLVFVVSLGQRRDRSIWYSVMAVGRTRNPPPEYATVAKAVGDEAVQWAANEGDFEDVT